MITDDHTSTATAVTDQLGIFSDRHDGDVLTGEDFAEQSAGEHPDAAARASSLAPVPPEQELRLVEGLPARGHAVAMTGDGIGVTAPNLGQLA
ncbi:MAG: hypothetical protein M5T61_03345 [Acidimicrobiia bacterium]|nr:hypothetical protein [Acidimicrobiia bacterium]